MKRLILIAIGALMLAGIQFIANCSNPLELTDIDDIDPIGPITEYDTVYVTDTLFIADTTIDTVFNGDTLIVIDTIINNDTIYIEDTLYVTDTLTVVDTVTIYEPEEGAYQTVCTILLANLREIIWMFDNEAGTYLFEIEATPSREFGMYTLLIDIDGHYYEWDLVDGHEFSVEVTIDENSTINIRPDKPLLLGHQVDICLTVSKR